jgi:hypothetical protein
MACATCWKWSNSGPSEAESAGSGDEFFRRERDADDAGGRGKTSSAGHAEDSAAAASQVARAAAMPWLARGAVGVAGVDGDYADRLPEARRFSLSMISGAAVTRLAVKAAAALAGASATMRAKSVRPLFLSPALVAPKRKPRGRGIGRRRTWWLTHLI